MFERLSALEPWRFELEMSDAAEGISQRFTLYPGRPFRQPALVSFPVPLYWRTLRTQPPWGTTWRDGTGALLVPPRDCALYGLDGATWEIDPPAGDRMYFSLNGEYSSDPSESSTSAVFFTLEPQSYTVTVKRGQDVIVRRSVQAQVNTYTRLALLFPDPS